MWFLPAGALLGLIGTLDLLTNVLAVRALGMGAVELGLLNALWTLAFVPAARHASALSEAGLSRRQVALGSAFLGLSLALLFSSLSRNAKWLAFAAYSAHAAAYAYAKTGVQTGVLESSSADSWGSLNRRISQAAVLTDGAAILLISRTWPMVATAAGFSALSAAALALAAAAGAVVPQPKIRFERIIGKIERALTKGLTPIHGFLAMTSVDYSGVGPSSLALAGPQLGGVGVGSLLLALAAFRLGNEYLFTPLPYVFIAVWRLKTSDVLFIYGMAKLLGFVGLALLPSDATSKGLYVLMGAARLLAAFAVLQAPQGAAAAALLSVVYVGNVVVDTTLYALYLEETGGDNVGLYNIAAEVSSLFGSLTSGLLAATAGVWGLLLATTALNAVPMGIVKKRWGHGL